MSLAAWRVGLGTALVLACTEQSGRVSVNISEWALEAPMTTSSRCPDGSVFCGMQRDEGKEAS